MNDRRTFMGRALLASAGALSVSEFSHRLLAAEPAAAPIRVAIRWRERAAGAETAEEKNGERVLLPAETAIVICDMWNLHWCKSATRRCGELAEKMAPILDQARRGEFASYTRPATRSISMPIIRLASGRWPCRSWRHPRRSMAGVRWKRCARASCRSTTPTAAAIASRSARTTRPGAANTLPFASPKRISFPMTGGRCTAISSSRGSRTCSTWACTRTCACWAVRSAFGK